MGRVERRLFAIGDELATLAEEERLVSAELEYHRHIADDDERDAAVSASDFDRLEAGLSRADVARFEKRLDAIDRRRAKLESTRLRLLERLES
ncbi:MAG: hypothetical protein OEX04_04325 [Acidimicrobiia bacterium]|nr:hypothetical protein [Acidimicrobiia bacterium]